MFNTTFKLLVASLSFVLTVATVSTSSAGTITSAPFSLGYGWNGPTGSQSWNDTETSGSNTPTTIGDFSFLPTFVGSGSSGAGPTFPGRVLTDSAVATDDVASSLGFNVDLAASFNGTVPSGTSPRLMINIDSIRVFVVHRAILGNTNPGISFVEDTLGHTATSPLFTGITGVTTSLGLQTISNYSNLTWNPDDYETFGTSFTRSFGFTSDDPDVHQYVIDGFEIFATVQLTFVPEPSSMVLISLGLVAMGGRGRRRRCRSSVRATRNV